MAFRRRSVEGGDALAPYVPRPHLRTVTTAWRLAAYRDELLAGGFTADEARELVLIAARDMNLVTELWFEVAAEPPLPKDDIRLNTSRWPIVAKPFGHTEDGREMYL